MAAADHCRLVDVFGDQFDDLPFDVVPVFVPLPSHFASSSHFRIWAESSNFLAACCWRI